MNFSVSDKLRIFISMMLISSPNPMFDHLLESSHRDDSDKWSNIGLCKDIMQVVSFEVCFTHLIWSSVVPSKSSWTICKFDKISISSEFKLVPCHTADFQQNIMLGIKQYGWKIRPHISWGLMSIHIVRKCNLRSTSISRNCKKIFLFCSKTFRGHCMFVSAQHTK